MFELIKWQILASLVQTSFAKKIGQTWPSCADLVSMITLLLSIYDVLTCFKEVVAKFANIIILAFALTMIFFQISFALNANMNLYKPGDLDYKMHEGHHIFLVLPPLLFKYMLLDFFSLLF